MCQNDARLLECQIQLALKIFQLIRNAPDIDRFPSVYVVKTHFLLENLSISEPSLGILEKFISRVTLL